jgi:hypothetical protein
MTEVLKDKDKDKMEGSTGQSEFFASTQLVCDGTRWDAMDGMDAMNGMDGVGRRESAWHRQAVLLCCAVLCCADHGVSRNVM